MKRIFLQTYNFPNCKHNSSCPVFRKEYGACLCIQDAANKEKLTGRCMYFEKDNKERR